MKWRGSGLWFGAMTPSSGAAHVRSRSLVIAATALLAFVAGCGKVAEDSSLATRAPDAGETWVAEAPAPDSSHRDVTTPASCEGLPGTDEELALTPRMDIEAEVLALLVAGTFTADTPTYERIRRDLASIRSRVPLLQDVRGRRYTSSITLVVEPTTFDSMKAGTYTAWDCLHARYGWNARGMSEPTSFPLGIVSGDLTGRYDMRAIVDLYADLPGVTDAGLDGFIDGPSVCADRDPDGTYHYVFDDASGDCPSGCMDHHRYYFVSDAAGQITKKGEHSRGDDTSVPDWVTRFAGADSHCY